MGIRLGCLTYVTHMAIDDNAAPGGLEHNPHNGCFLSVFSRWLDNEVPAPQRAQVEEFLRQQWLLAFEHQPPQRQPIHLQWVYRDQVMAEPFGVQYACSRFWMGRYVAQGSLMDAAVLQLARVAERLMQQYPQEAQHLEMAGVACSSFE